jgi:cell division protein FtsZ
VETRKFPNRDSNGAALKDGAALKAREKDYKKMEALKFEIQDETRKGARIKVIGIGGGGSNAVGRMYEEGLDGVEFYVMNTDAQALESSSVPNKIQIGARITGGLGAGSDPAIGRQAALEDTERILNMIEGADLVFITAGLGGGTGAGAAPVVATLAKQLEALTIAVVTKPFSFEGGKRMRQAERSVNDLATSVDILTTIPNDRLLKIAPKGASMAAAFKMADDVLRQAVLGISEIVLTPGLINLDFSDIKAAISGMGHALIGNAVARGENAAVEAARAAISSPLLEDTKIKGARQVLMNITAASTIGLHELNEACSIIREAADMDDLQLNFGVISNDAMGDSVKVTVIATGFVPPATEDLREPAIEPKPASEFFAERHHPEPAPHPPAAPVITEPFPEPAFDEELDVPAYLRQGKLLN